MIKHLLFVAILTLVMTESGYAFQLNLNDIGNLTKIVVKAGEANVDVSEENEVDIGRGLAANLLGAAPLVDDDAIQRYVNRVGQWLATHTERRELNWHFGVIASDNFNAFAAPGGYIFVTRGLFAMMRSESELAGVLAHEMAHVLKRHHLQAIKKQAQRELAVDILSALADQNSGAVDMLVGAGMQVYARGLDREDEYEADQMGVVIAARAGYEPFGLPGLLMVLDGVGSEDEKMSLLSATHPSFSDRLDRLDGLMNDDLVQFENAPKLTERFLKVQQNLYSKN